MRSHSDAPRIEFVVTGDEVVRGLIADTNTAQTASKLFALGLDLRGATVVPDRGEAIRRALLAVADRADVCIVSGGLGPTEDDLTAACAAQAAGVPLVLHQPWLTHLEARWARVRGNEPMPQNNQRQAWVPEGAEVLGNPDGSAPAFALSIDRCRYFFLPGVPSEYHRIIDELVLPRIREVAGVAGFASRTLQCYGITESALDERVQPVLRAHPRVRFGFRTRFPENHLSLSVRADSDRAAQELLAPVERECRGLLGALVYSADGSTFAQSVGERVASRHETLAVAESCTAGMLGELLTEPSGSSRWFKGGFLVYDNGLKRDLLGIAEALLVQHGAVSEPVARAMAEAARTRSSSTHGLAITGVAGPTGGTADKPVGLTWVAVASPAKTVAKELRLRGNRQRNRTQACFEVLQLLRAQLDSLRD